MPSLIVRGAVLLFRGCVPSSNKLIVQGYKRCLISLIPVSLMIKHLRVGEMSFIEERTRERINIIYL